MKGQAWGWVMLSAGLWCLGIGAWIVAVGTWSIGAGLVLIGAFSLGTGACVVAQPWKDSVDREIDRWEENWGSEWEPACPVHGRNLCYTRTGRCPGVRERVS